MSSRPEFKILDLQPHQIWDTSGLDHHNVKPKRLFDLPPNPRIATMGSCFAIELAKWLKRNGFRYVESPNAHDGSGPWGKVYNTVSMLQLLDTAWHGGEPAWVVGDRWLDPYRKWVTYPNAATYEHGRATLASETDWVLRNSDLLILTLGLSEVWGRAPYDVFYQVPPESIYDPARHSFWSLTAYDNELNLGGITECLSQYPDLEVLFTLSPVPLRATFRDMDVYQANSESKASLREALARSGVPYFPAYELVFTRPVGPFIADGRHVKPNVIASVMESFAETYLEG